MVEAIIMILQQLGLGTALALVVGKWLKDKTPFANEAIPIINFLVQILGRIAFEASGAEASFFGDIFSNGQSILVNSLMSTVFAAGMQTSGLNTGRYFKQQVFKRLAGLLVQFSSKRR